MAELSLEQIAGMKLKTIIKENYKTQQDFADDYGMEIRTVNRYVNNGITKLATIEELADFFHVDYKFFLSLD